jgi:hypothetical protein
MRPSALFWPATVMEYSSVSGFLYFMPMIMLQYPRKRIDPSHEELGGDQLPS